tara:strand:+ start:8346 stop:8663 length:318 start_codon:yes stop_codon:yes gene_type:complete
MSEENMMQMQLIQQNLQHLVVQKQQLQRSLAETESALKEIESTSRAYKVLGGIMVAVDKEEMKRELSEKQETFSLRIKTLNSQEEMLKKKTEDLQQHLTKEMKNE